MNTLAPLPQIDQSGEQHTHSPSNENKHENDPEKSREEMNNKSPPIANPPAIIVSAEATPPMNFRSAEKRRQSWIADRYKLFNMATDDLLKNTPGKLKSFFHRALRIQTHFDPSKQKKVKDSGKQKSASQLKRYSVINSDENGSLKSSEKGEHGSTGLPSPNSTTSTSGTRSPCKKSSEQEMTSVFSLEEDSVDGRCSPRGTHLDTVFSQPPFPNMLEASQLQSPSECGSPSNRTRCQSTPVFYDLNSETPSRRTASHRECEINNAHSTSDAQIKEEEKHKHRKSPFRIFKRYRSKCKETE